MEGEDLDTTTEHNSVELTAQQKRKQWLKKSKTISTLVYKSKDDGGGGGGGGSGGLVTPAPSLPSSPPSFSPYKPQHFSFDTGLSYNYPLSGSHGYNYPQGGSLLAKQSTNRDSETQGNTFNNVTRVVHAGLSSDPYFNLRKNQAFLADMHNWAMENATSLPFMVNDSNNNTNRDKNRDRKR